MPSAALMQYVNNQHFSRYCIAAVQDSIAGLENLLFTIFSFLSFF